MSGMFVSPTLPDVTPLRLERPKSPCVCALKPMPMPPSDADAKYVSEDCRVSLWTRLYHPDKDLWDWCNPVTTQLLCQPEYGSQDNFEKIPSIRPWIFTLSRRASVEFNGSGRMTFARLGTGRPTHMVIAKERRWNFLRKAINDQTDPPAHARPTGELLPGVSHRRPLQPHPGDGWRQGASLDLSL